jgi:hypothetical protein
MGMKKPVLWNGRPFYASLRAYFTPLENRQLRFARELLKYL